VVGGVVGPGQAGQDRLDCGDIGAHLVAGELDGADLAQEHIEQVVPLFDDFLNRAMT